MNGVKEEDEEIEMIEKGKENNVEGKTAEKNNIEGEKADKKEGEVKVDEEAKGLSV